MSTPTLLVGAADKANMDILLSMLGEPDKEIISRKYGIFGKTRIPPEDLARRYGIDAGAIEEIVEKDLRKIAITPEWQLMLEHFSPTVIQKISSDTE